MLYTFGLFFLHWPDLGGFEFHLMIKNVPTYVFFGCYSEIGSTTDLSNCKKESFLFFSFLVFFLHFSIGLFLTLSHSFVADLLQREGSCF